MTTLFNWLSYVWRPKWRQNIITALTKLPQGWVSVRKHQSTTGITTMWTECWWAFPESYTADDSWIVCYQECHYAAQFPLSLEWNFSSSSGGLVQICVTLSRWFSHWAVHQRIAFFHVWSLSRRFQPLTEELWLPLRRHFSWIPLYTWKLACAAGPLLGNTHLHSRQCTLNYVAIVDTNQESEECSGKSL